MIQNVEEFVYALSHLIHPNHMFIRSRYIMAYGHFGTIWVQIRDISSSRPEGHWITRLTFPFQSF